MIVEFAYRISYLKFTASDNAHTTVPLVKFDAIIIIPRRCYDRLFGERKQVQTFFNQQTNKAIWTEHKLTAGSWSKNIHNKQIDIHMQTHQMLCEKLYAMDV